jgi:hypothetical protein
MWTKLVSMECTDEEKLDAMACVPAIKSQPDYPWGLRINLNEGSLKKLEAAGLEGQPDIGDYIDLRCFARVTSVSSNETEGGANRCVELQIEEIALENETTERPGS